MSRKYRQSGYQDDESSKPERRGPRPPRQGREGPRGRGLGAPSDTVFRCRDCGEKWPLANPVTAQTVCARCGADLHSCVNCRHFDTASPNECRKPIAQRIAKKSKANECPEFAPKQVQEYDSDKKEPSDPRAAFDALFR